MEYFIILGVLVLDCLFLVSSIPKFVIENRNVPFDMYADIYKRCVEELPKNTIDNLPKNMEVMIGQYILCNTKIGPGSLNIVTLKPVSDFPGHEMVGLKSDVILHARCAYWFVNNVDTKNTNDLLVVVYIQYLAVLYPYIFMSMAQKEENEIKGEITTEQKMELYDRDTIKFFLYLLCFGGPAPNDMAFAKLAHVDGMVKEENDFWEPTAFDIVTEVSRWFNRSEDPSTQEKEIIPTVAMKNLNTFFSKHMPGCYVPKLPSPHFIDEYYQLMRVKNNFSHNVWSQPYGNEECKVSKFLKNIVHIVAEEGPSVFAEAGPSGTSADAED